MNNVFEVEIKELKRVIHSKRTATWLCLILRPKSWLALLSVMKSFWTEKQAISKVNSNLCVRTMGHVLVTKPSMLALLLKIMHNQLICYPGT